MSSLAFLFVLFQDSRFDQTLPVSQFILFGTPHQFKLWYNRFQNGMIGGISMNFEQISCFIAAAEEPTFLDAAEILHITQSSLSKQIRKLEKELDITLMDRSKRKASLTEAGEMFYREALVLVRQYNRMLSQMASCRAASEQILRIGALPVMAQYGLTARLKSFRDLHANARIILDEAEEHELLEGIKYGKYDFIIVREELVQDEDFQTYFLARDELIAVLPCRHPAARISSRFKGVGQEPQGTESGKHPGAGPDVTPGIALRQIAEEPFILMHPYTSVYHCCMKEFDRQGIHPDIVRTARVETIISTVAEGEAVSLIPKNNLQLFRDMGITSVPLDPPVPLNLVLAGNRKKEESVLQKELVRFLAG